MIEDRVFSVYIHKFPNGKQYVGITSVKPETRWKNGNGYKHNKVMYEDIKKYGWDNIEHILFNDEDILYDEEEACYIEKCLIDSWDLTNPEIGYNLCSGGTSSYLHHKDTRKKISLSKEKPVIQFSLDGTKIAEFSSIMEVERKLNIYHSLISACCKNKKKSAGGYHWKYKFTNEIKKSKIPQKKPVIQFSLDGTKIAEFSSIAEAERKLNINSSSITSCCKGKLKSAGNFLWHYKINNLESIKPRSYKGVPIIQYTLNKTFLNEFPSIAEASRFTNVYISGICNCCSGKRKTAGGYIWKYKE